MSDVEILLRLSLIQIELHRIATKSSNTVLRALAIDTALFLSRLRAHRWAP